LAKPTYRFLSNPSENLFDNIKCIRLPIKWSVKAPFTNRSRVCSWYRVSIRLQHLPNLVKHQSRNHQFDDIINVARLTHKGPFSTRNPIPFYWWDKETIRTIFRQDYERWTKRYPHFPHRSRNNYKVCSASIFALSKKYRYTVLILEEEDIDYQVKLFYFVWEFLM